MYQQDAMVLIPQSKSINRLNVHFFKALKPVSVPLNMVPPLKNKRELGDRIVDQYTLAEHSE